MATYFVAGLLAVTFMDYTALWETTSFAHYRRMDSPWVAAGPGLQFTRGLILALVLWPFRRVILDEPRGGIALFGLLVGLGVLSTYGAAPASVEGVIYTSLPWSAHLRGLPEVVGQAAVFSALIVGWHRHPHRAWGVVLGGIAALAVLASIAGVLLGPQGG
jgi:hypothetical protein